MPPTAQPQDPADLAALTARLRAAGCVFAEEEATLLSGADESLVQRRLAGEPLEYVLGWVEFAGLRLVIEPGVFVPRRRSEALVTQALKRLPIDAVPVVLDLCCGTGALGAAVRHVRPDIRLVSADISPAAVICARQNLTTPVFEGNLFDPLPDELRGHVDVLIANVPYVPTTDIASMPSEARDHEPALALDGGPDGLDVLRLVAGQAQLWLAPKGVLLSEIAERQIDSACAALAAVGLTPSVARDADRDATVLIGANGLTSC